MPTELPGTLRTYTRDQIRDKYLRDYRLRDPDAETGPGTQPYKDASTLADQLVVLHYDAVVIANGTTDENSAGEWLEKRGAAAGVQRGDATGGSGFVTVSASAGGGFIAENVEIRHKKTRLRFKCTVGKTYQDGEQVPIIGIDTGPATNLAPGEVMEWTSPPVGIGPTALVFEQSDRSGLTGGRDRQDDPEYRASIQERRANPPASGNDAAYQEAVRRTPGIGIQQVFTYPAIKGAGTTGIAFTLRPARPGAARRPNAAQLALVEANLKAQFPGDDGIFLCQLLGQAVSVVLRVTWAKSAAGWLDSPPWPAYASPAVKVAAAPSPTATSFRLYTTASSPPDAQVGQTIAFYNPATGKFVRKRIGAVTKSVSGGETRWGITATTTNNASDTSYVPVAGQLASPWSDSLDLAAAPVIAHFDGLGAGEQLATFHDPGRRQRRQPEGQNVWPYAITNRVLNRVFDLSAISDATLAEPTVPHVATVGTPGVLAYLLELSDLAIQPQ